MRKLFIMSFMLLYALTIAAQQKLSYDYDNAGNRICRTIVLNAKSTSVNKTKTTPESYEEFIAEKHVLIYPNPVQSELTISISGYGESAVGEYSLFKFDGSQVIRNKFMNEITTVDMSGLKSGHYIMLIVINEEQSTWKIIKE